MVETLFGLAVLTYVSLLALYIYEYGELRVRFVSRLAVLAAGTPIAGFLIAGAVL